MSLFQAMMRIHLTLCYCRLLSREGRMLWRLQIPELPWEAVESLCHRSPNDSCSSSVWHSRSGDHHLWSSRAASPATPSVQEAGVAFTSACCLWNMPDALLPGKRRWDVFFRLLPLSLPAWGRGASASHLEGLGCHTGCSNLWTDPVPRPPGSLHVPCFPLITPMQFDQLIIRIWDPGCLLTAFRTRAPLRRGSKVWKWNGANGMLWKGWRIEDQRITTNWTICFKKKPP